MVNDKRLKISLMKKNYCNFADGEMAEWSNAAVLKTVEGHTSGGSNPSFSAKFKTSQAKTGFFYFVFRIHIKKSKS